MTPWEVVEQALRMHRRDQVWLASELGTTPQVITNWKRRGVPARHYRRLAEVFGLTVDQIEGLEPLPWAKSLPWLFSAELHARLSTLDEDAISRLEENVLTTLAQMEGRGNVGSRRSGQTGAALTPLGLDKSGGGGTVELIPPLSAPEKSKDVPPRSRKSASLGKRQEGRRAPAGKAR